MICSARFLAFILPLALGFGVLGLAACDGPSSNRPQDKRVMQRQQQLNQVLQALEHEANQVVAKGHQAYLDVKRSTEELAADTGRRMHQLATVSDEVVNKTKQLEEVTASVQGGSQQVMDMARKAADYVGLLQEPVPTDKTPPALPQFDPNMLKLLSLESVAVCVPHR